MSINIHHGPPGSYKSAGVILRFAVPALIGDDDDFPDGRVVVTNVRGFDSIEKVESAYGVKCAPDSKILNLQTETAEALAHAARWFHWAPIGALIILDEAQAVYPSSRRDFKLESLDYPGGKEQAQADDRPADVLLAFDMHRHYNWDLFLCTPNIGKIHREIRQSTQAAFRHWDMTGLLPWKNGRWKELEHDPENSGKAASHSFGVPKEYKIDKRVFDCYQSTKTGKAKGAAGRDSIFKDPKLRFVAVVLVICIGVLIYNGSKIVDREMQRFEGSEVDVLQAGAGTPVLRDAGPDERGDSSGDAPDGAVAVPHPLDGFRFRIAGRFSSDVIFHASAAGDEYSFTSRELTQYGYTFVALGNCRLEIWFDGNPVSEAYCQPRKIEEPEVRMASFGPLPLSEESQGDSKTAN